MAKLLQVGSDHKLRVRKGGLTIGVGGTGCCCPGGDDGGPGGGGGGGGTPISACPSGITSCGNSSGLITIRLAFTVQAGWQPVPHIDPTIVALAGGFSGAARLGRSGTTFTGQSGATGGFIHFSNGDTWGTLQVLGNAPRVLCEASSSPGPVRWRFDNTGTAWCVADPATSNCPEGQTYIELAGGVGNPGFAVPGTVSFSVDDAAP